MDDLISSRAAIDALREYLVGKRCPDDGTLTCRLIENEVINKLPSAQPEIIYCGECTKMKVDSVFHDCWCSEIGKKVWINHYCGYAERKEVTT